MSNLRDTPDSPAKCFRMKLTALRVAVRTLLLLLLCAVLTSALFLTVSAEMVRTTSEGIVTMQTLQDASIGAEYDCILVLGAGLKSDNATPSDMLYDRVSVAVELYKAADGQIPLLMSGDHTGDYNEVGVMKALAVELGVPSEDVFLDHEGYSTFESIRHAKERFGASRIVIITQEYHLYRALHISRELRIRAVGVSADLRPYKNQIRYDIREVMARFKDLFVAAKASFDIRQEDYVPDVTTPVDLNGNGDLT